ncbi:hypothetical protein LOK49_LG06G02216 [Camellia lanceoleosa]|uniref:Uncharacterized protein n=1 Tax=Camellia lanceoleosa TaxID=1840588 RepID=A0ACC0H9Y3_9ERIC|nr:hypothetical protein LOK49_LG06G02216 [Camellia lanceoleosa]
MSLPILSCSSCLSVSQSITAITISHSGRIIDWAKSPSLCVSPLKQYCLPLCLHRHRHRHRHRHHHHHHHLFQVFPLSLSLSLSLSLCSSPSSFNSPLK